MLSYALARRTLTTGAQFRPNVVTITRRFVSSEKQECEKGSASRRKSSWYDPPEDSSKNRWYHIPKDDAKLRWWHPHVTNSQSSDGKKVRRLHLDKYLLAALAVFWAGGITRRNLENADYFENEFDPDAEFNPSVRYRFERDGFVFLNGIYY
jgi:hypothetical protein